MRLDLPIPSDCAIRQVAALEPFLDVFSRELRAFSELAESPTDWGFFVTAPCDVDLRGHGWERRPEAPWVPVEQRITSLERSVEGLIARVDRCHGDVERMLARLDEVRVSGELALGDVSGTRSLGRRQSRGFAGGRGRVRLS